jgi:hypothetical protein
MQIWLICAHGGHTAVSDLRARRGRERVAGLLDPHRPCRRYETLRIGMQNRFHDLGITLPLQPHRQHLVDQKIASSQAGSA